MFSISKEQINRNRTSERRKRGGGKRKKKRGNGTQRSRFLIKVVRGRDADQFDEGGIDISR